MPLSETFDRKMKAPIFGSSRIKSRITKAISAVRHPHSIRFQITFTVWLLLVLTFGLSNLILFSAATRSMILNVQKKLAAESDFLTLSIEEWQDEISNTLTLLTNAYTLRTGDVKAAKHLLNAAAHAYPYREWRVRDSSGKLLVMTGKQLFGNLQPEEIRSRPYFQKALKGQPVFEVVRSNMLRTGCLTAAAPYYPIKSNPTKNIKPTPSGVVSFCLRLSDVGADSGINRLEATIHPTEEDNSKREFFNPSQNDYTGHAFFLVDSSGHLVFPASKGLDYVSMQTGREVNQGPWAPLVMLADGKHKGFNQITVRGHELFALVREIPDRKWTSVIVIDKNTAFRGLYTSLRNLVLLQVFTLIFITWATFRVCKNLAKPLHLAGRALRQIRRGVFTLNLPPGPANEMGELLDDINETGKHLKELISKETESALVAQQIQTARRIHQDFLIKKLPTSEHYDLSVFTAPALEVGADWYDALEIQGTTFVVIADVCDKGVGSALYMSVFRSLLRYSLQRFSLETNNKPSDLLTAVAMLVNDYMAENHGQSAMFATVFIGAYEDQTQTMTYLTAGHERPFLLRPNHLEQLEVTGPAIGIFKGSSFKTNTLKLQPGDLLFAYTDGLPDARNGKGDGWCLEPLKKLLLNADRSTLTAQTMTETVVEQIALHVGGTEAFDDLTLLALHIQPTP